MFMEKLDIHLAEIEKFKYKETPQQEEGIKKLVSNLEDLSNNLEQAKKEAMVN